VKQPEFLDGSRNAVAALMQTYENFGQNKIARKKNVQNDSTSLKERKVLQ